MNPSPLGARTAFAMLLAGLPAPAAQAPAHERICRHVRLDNSIRRKTKLWRTVAQWRARNNIR